LRTTRGATRHRVPCLVLLLDFYDTFVGIEWLVIKITADK
jgi:hypothetical protein